MTLHHRIDGAGDRVVVLSSSLGTTLELWDPQVPALGDRFRIVRYDHPGHGESALPTVGSVEALARELLTLLDDLGFERVSLCGLSLGGAVGMRLALDVPERIERLVLACTSPRFRTPEFWDQRARLVRRFGVEAVADVVLEGWFTPSFGDVRRYRDMLVSTPPEGYARCCEALRDWDARGLLGAVRAPTLAIAGADDPAAPLGQLASIASEIPDARLEVIPDARHLANVERAAEFNALVAAFL